MIGHNDRRGRHSMGHTGNLQCGLVGQELLAGNQAVDAVGLRGGLRVVWVVVQADLHNRNTRATQTQGHGEAAVAGSAGLGHVARGYGRARHERNDCQGKQGLPDERVRAREDASAGGHGSNCKADSGVRTA